MTSPNESNEVMRADFESWINATYGHDCIRRDEAGDYEDIATCSQWDAWQAASIVTPQPQTVREALHKAAAICENWAAIANNYGFNGDADNYIAIRDEIRTLIEPLSVTDSEPLSKLGQAIKKARGSYEPPSIPLLFTSGDSVAVQEPVWKIQAEVLERMADILVVEIKDNSHNAMFRSGVDIAAHRLRVRAQMLMDFQEFDRFPSLSPTLDKE